MAEWIECTLGDLVTFQRGHDLPKSQMQEGQYPVVGSNGIIGFHNDYTTDNPSITVGRSGNVGKPFIYYGKTWSHNTTLYVKDYKGNDPVFVFYFLKTMDLANYAGGSAVPTLNRNHIHTLPVLIPKNVEIQRKIGTFLKQFDDKIEENERINNNLFEQAQSLFKSWFIDFDPFSNTMPEDWAIGTIGDIIEVYDSKRVPLSGSQRDKMDKIYPYYGATSLMDYVDDYLFDGIYLLLGEDGTVVDRYGFPILQYVEGKFWVNNHAHILRGKNGFSVETLYLLFSLTNIKSIVTGAVQQKISQSNLKKIEIIIPAKEILSNFDEIVQPIFAQIRNLRREIEKLKQLRDELLPKLMSGEIDVSDIEI